MDSVRESICESVCVSICESVCESICESVDNVSEVQVLAGTSLYDITFCYIFLCYDVMCIEILQLLRFCNLLFPYEIKK